MLPYPDARVDLKREVLARHAPEVLLAAQQWLHSQRRPEA